MGRRKELRYPLIASRIMKTQPVFSSMFPCIFGVPGIVERGFHFSVETLRLMHTPNGEGLLLHWVHSAAINFSMLRRKPSALLFSGFGIGVG